MLAVDTAVEDTTDVVVSVMVVLVEVTDVVVVEPPVDSVSPAT